MTLGDKIVIVREAIAEDIPQLVELRMMLFAATGELPEPAAQSELRSATARFFEKACASKLTRTWIATDGHQIVATASLSEFHRLPYHGNLIGREAYLLNVFTLPAYRRKGVAVEILKHIISFARVERFGRIWLHATAAGRPLYER